MDAIGCDKALALLEQGWDDGLPEAGFRQAVTHLAGCPGCASEVRSWSRVDSALNVLADALDRAAPRTAIPGRVMETLARGPGVVAHDEGRPDDLALGRFLKRLGSEAALRDRVAGAGDPASRLDVLITLAREHGFRFSEETVRRTLMTRPAANDGELSEEQLEAVAGGASTGLALLQDLLGGLPPGGNGVDP
jgi:predicted ribosomally synthesized peptide with nif11-like leader